MQEMPWGMHPVTGCMISHTLEVLKWRTGAVAGSDAAAATLQKQGNRVRNQ